LTLAEHRGYLPAVPAALAAYVCVFVLCGLPWLRIAGHAIPAGAVLTSRTDARIIVWALAWVSHALVAQPSHLFDANIFHPAPGQLAGSEHFASSQLLFAPVYWVTGNPVLATNVVAMVSYPLAGIAMDRFLLALGCSAGPAWVGGLFFMLGPLRATGNLQLIQYMNFYLPLVGLALVRLREQPSTGRAGFLFLALGCAVFSSYYMAVLAAFAAAVVGIGEWTRATPGRSRFAVLALVAAVAAGAMLVLASAPYFGRPEQSVRELASLTTRSPRWRTAAADSLLTWSPIELVTAALGLLTLAVRGEPGRRAAALGLAMVAIAGPLLLGPGEVSVLGYAVPLPFNWMIASPLHFFRIRTRMVVLAGFGTALLSAAALEALRSRLRPALARTMLVLLAVLQVATRGPALGGTKIDELTGWTRKVDADVGAFIGTSDGPLLELPLVDAAGHRTAPAAMVGSTRHWRPLVLGWTGYWPAHRGAVVNAVRRLPAADALDDLVDMTGLRWILLHPPTDWPAATPEQPSEQDYGDALAGLPGVKLALKRGGWRLFHVTRPARHPQWYDAIAAGPRSGATPLGTALAPLPPETAIATIGADRLPTSAHAGGWLPGRVRVRNAGTRAWPVVIRFGTPKTHVVRLKAAWIPAAASGGLHGPSATSIALPRDVAIGDEIVVNLLLQVPDAPGAWVLMVRPAQVGGADFTGEGNVPLRWRVDVVPPPG
jgi:hypothetical protein